jgi:hypothetical protein
MQAGSITVESRKRGSDVWCFRWREPGANGRRIHRRIVLGTSEELKSIASARNMTLTYGLRWDYNTSPSSPNGTTPFTVNEVSDLSTATIAPVGTPLWHSQKDNFAPRLGLAWQVPPKLVLRAGAGIFYDLGYSDITNVMISFPYIQEKPLILNTSFPLTPSVAAPPVFTTPPSSITIGSSHQFRGHSSNA